MALIKHVITGGPCSGKTTTIEALRKKGFQVIEEASRILIEEQNRIGGDLVPWKRLYDFNIRVTEIQLERESRLKEGIFFLDRGIIENLGYCEWGGIQPPQNLLEAVQASSYGLVFFLQPLPFFEVDKVRHDSREEGDRLPLLIKKSYQSRGYEVIEIPPVSVEERVEMILASLSKKGME